MATSTNLFTIYYCAFIIIRSPFATYFLVHAILYNDKTAPNLSKKCGNFIQKMCLNETRALMKCSINPLVKCKFLNRDLP